MKKETRHNEEYSIEELMKFFIKENNLSKGLRQVTIEKLWVEQMGNGVANYTQKITLKGETLLVHLNSSVLREELSYGKDKIIKIMNEAFGDTIITKIILS